MTDEKCPACADSDRPGFVVICEYYDRMVPTDVVGEHKLTSGKEYMRCLECNGTAKPTTIVGASGDWSEDFGHENGNYQRRCVSCGELFIGHKRRVTCKVCASKPPTPISERDNLWCQALMSSGLELEMICSVLDRFKELRDD